MLQDIRYGIRTLLHAPAFSLAVVAILALGIAANATMFSLVNSLLLRPLPLPEPERLVRIDTGSSHASYPTYRAFVEQATVFSGVAAYRIDPFNISEAEIPERVSGEYVSGNYFTVLGVTAARGRLLGAADDTSGAPLAAVISERLWKGRFGMAPDTVGRTLRLNGRPVTVVGIAPETFRGTYPIVLTPELWVSLSARAQLLPGPDRTLAPNNLWLQLTARLRDNASDSEAQAAVVTIGRNLKQDFPTENRTLDETTTYGLTGVDAYQGIGFAPLVLLFLGFLSLMALMVLLIACANIANLFLARAWARQQEIAIRGALGANRGHILRQLLTESLIVAIAGGGLGCLIAFLAIGVIERLQALLPIPLGLTLAVDYRVLAFVTLISVVSGLIFGIVPAWKGAKATITPLAVRRTERLKDLLVFSEVALCFVVLVCAGLFLRSLQSAGGVDPGFETQQIVTAAVDLETSGYAEGAGLALVDRLLNEARALPGVRAASVARIVPMSLNRIEFRVKSDQGARLNSMILANSVGPDYFQTMKIPLLSGREFTSADSAQGQRVVVVSQAMANRFWPGESAVGKAIQIAGRGPGEWLPPQEVVGVVRDSKYYSLGEAPQLVIYWPFAQTYSSEAILHVATNAPAASLRASIQKALHATAPSLSPSVAVMAENLEVAFLPARIAAFLFLTFALVGLLLAMAGIYALIAYTVTQRRKEIGIRMALGAERATVVRMIVGKGVILTAKAMTIGLAAALGLSQLLKSMLIGISPADPITIIATGILMLFTAALASWLPSRRAAAINPAVTLRSQA